MIPAEVRVLKPELEMGSGDAQKVFIVWFDPGVTTGWCVMRINLEMLMAGGLRAVCLAHPDPDVFSFSAGSFSGPEPYQAELMMALLRGTWMHGEGVWDAGPYSDLFVAGYESFSLRVFSTDDSLLSSPRVAAAFGALAWRRVFVPVLTQTPSDALSTIPEARLKALNLWTGVPGKDGEHQRDATAHAALCARKFVDRRWVEEVKKKMKWLK